jgi:hypothetical protein
MLRIVVGGQIMKSEIFDFIEKYYGKGNVELAVKNDLDAVMAMKAGQFDYYIGACNTGGGGALAMAIALLGPSKCQTISMPGKIFSDEDIQKAVDSGKIAFGFTAQHMENVLPVWLKAIDAKNVG